MASANLVYSSKHAIHLACHILVKRIDEIKWEPMEMEGKESRIILLLTIRTLKTAVLEAMH